MLSKAEENIMEILWVLKKGFMKDIIKAIPEPKPAKTTVATLLKRMIEKEAVGYKTYGNSREYYPRISKQDYFGRYFKNIKKKFFDNSPSQFASFFALETNLDLEELEALKAAIDEKIKKKRT
jgi:predicted transcriptional regulator